MPQSEMKFTTLFHATDKCVDILREHHLGPVFPRLQRLNIFSDTAQYIPMFIHPTLISLVMYTTTDENYIAVLESLAVNAPNLREFSVCDSEFDLEEDDPIRTRFDQTICSLHCLSKLNFAPVTLTDIVLAHLSSSPNFHALNVCVSEYNCRAWTLPTWGFFNSLVRLDVSLGSPDVDLLTSFLTSLSESCLRDLKIIFEPACSSASFARFLAACGRFLSLQTLTIGLSRFFSMRASQAVWKDKIFEAQILDPLYSIASIKTFRLHWIPIKFTSGDLERMVSSWPTLKNLTLRSQKPGISPDDLAIFASGLPYLSNLSVELEPVPEDWTWTKPEQEVDRPPRVNALQCLDLDLRYFSPSAKKEVNALIAHLFPSTPRSRRQIRGGQ